MTPDLVWKGPHIHISTVIFVIRMILMNVFNSPYSFVNMFIISFFALNSIILLDIIVNYLYLFFLRSCKTNTKCCDKNEKTRQWCRFDVTRSAARHIVVSKKIVFWSLYELYKYIDFTRFLYKIYLNRWRRKD